MIELDDTALHCSCSSNHIWYTFFRRLAQTGKVGGVVKAAVERENVGSLDGGRGGGSTACGVRLPVHVDEIGASSVDHVVEQTKDLHKVNRLREGKLGCHVF